MTRVSLPPPQDVGDDLLSLARRRRVTLPRRCAPVPLRDLSTVLACSVGPLPARPGSPMTPDDGRRPLIEIVVVAHDVEGLQRGMFDYDPVGHALVTHGAVAPEVFHARVSDPFAPAQPSFTVALLAPVARVPARGGPTEYRLSLLEAGHVAQAVLTVSTSLGLASLPWAGFVASAADRLLGVDDGRSSCAYLVAVSGEVRLG